LGVFDATNFRPKKNVLKTDFSVTTLVQQISTVLRKDKGTKAIPVTGREGP
jgi:hypothetical protein